MDAINRHSAIFLLIAAALFFSIPKQSVSRFCYDILLIISLIIMGVNLWRAVRISKKSPDTLKEYGTFADIVNEDDRSYKAKKRSLNKQHIATIRNRDN